MTPALKTNPGFEYRRKIQKRATFQEDSFKSMFNSHFFSFLVFFGFTKMEEAQHQGLIKTCQLNLQKRLPDNSQNDHQQKSSKQ